MSQAAATPARHRWVRRLVRRRVGPDDRGTATAEFALVLPAVVLLAVLGVWALAVVMAQLRCVDAAGLGARALARGEEVAAVEALVRESAPRGARFQLSRDGDLVRVEVSAVVHLPGPWRGAGSGVTVSDRAVALAEDTGPASDP